MKLCLAQIQSETGAVASNVRRHLDVLRQLDRGAADLVVFPELSLTNYDPDIAGVAAMRTNDHRIVPLQRYADETRTAVAVGAPLRTEGRPHIAMLVFLPGQPTTVVGKRYLHEDEIAYFSPANAGASVLGLAVPVGVAICYEISVRAHANDLARAGATLYLASVAKTPGGVVAARATLAATATRLRVPALMVNSVGTCEGTLSGGGSLVLDHEGRLICQLGSSAEGFLLYDTADGTASARTIAK